MRDEVLEKVISSDSTVVPRYDIVKPDGTKVAENVQVVLKNNVLVSGTPLNKQNLLKDTTAEAFELNPAAAVPDDALKAIRDSISYCPKLKVTVIAGATLYVKNIDTGVQKSYQVPSTGIVTVDIWDYGTYSVWGVLGGVNTSSATVAIDTTKIYTTSVDFYVTYWKFSVAAETGATIRATHTDGTEISGVVGSNNTCTLALPKTGTWTAVGVYDGCNSNTYTYEATTATENTTKNTNMVWITLVISVSAGSNITISSGSTSKGGTSTGSVYKAWLPFKGTWAVTAVLGSSIATASVNVTEYINYSVALTYYVTYGIRIPLSNSSPTAVEYTDDALGMSTGYTAWSTKKIFSDIKPCLLLNGVVQYYLNKNNLTQKEDGTAATINSFTVGDVMVEVPKIGYRIYSDSTYLYVKITNNPNLSDFCYLAHSLNTVNDCSKIYYGAYLMYHTSTGAYSVSATTPSINNLLGQVRSAVANKGTGYQMMSFYPWVLLQCLYLIVYKDLNGQTVLGKGYSGLTSAATAKAAGGTNTKGPCFGEANGSEQMCFLNIEDFWGNVFQWLDGAYVDNTGNLKTAFNNFNDTGNSYPYTHALNFTSTSQNFIQAVQGTNASGFLPKVAGGSATTYFCDVGYLVNNSALRVGGSFDTYAGGVGPFCMNVNNPTSNSGNTGARLMYKRKG